VLCEHLIRGQTAQRAVRSEAVVIILEGLDFFLCVVERKEPVDVQALVTKAFLVSPVVFDSFFKHWEGNVVRITTGAPEFFDHAHGAVRVSGMNHDGRGGLQLRISCEPESDCVAGAFVVVTVGVVVFRVQIMVEEDGIVGIGAEKLLGLLDIVGHVDVITFEACGKPAMSAFVVVEQKDSDRVTFGPDRI
jgi:hypothetical protein